MKEKILAMLPEVVQGKKYVVICINYSEAAATMQEVRDEAPGFNYDHRRRSIICPDYSKGFVRFIIAQPHNRAQLAGYELDGFLLSYRVKMNFNEVDMWRDELTIRCARSGGGEIR